MCFIININAILNYQTITKVIKLILIVNWNFTHFLYGYDAFPTLINIFELWDGSNLTTGLVGFYLRSTTKISNFSGLSDLTVIQKRKKRW